MNMMSDLIDRQALLEKKIRIPIARIVTEDKTIYRDVVFENLFVVIVRIGIVNSVIAKWMNRIALIRWMIFSKRMNCIQKNVKVGIVSGSAERSQRRMNHE